MESTIQLNFEGLSDKELVLAQQTIHTLIARGVVGFKNGSAEVFFDDEGLIQKIIYRKMKRKRDGEELKLISPGTIGTATANFDTSGTVGTIVYETVWKKI